MEIQISKCLTVVTNSTEQEPLRIRLVAEVFKIFPITTVFRRSFYRILYYEAFATYVLILFNLIFPLNAIFFLTFSHFPLLPKILSK